MQGVFQDPFSSYNPVFKVDRVLGMMRATYLPELSADEWKAKLRKSLEAVSLEQADVLGKYPHQLSGGQLQRLMIARALLLDLKFLVADEIISMLDASTRIDVLNLLGDLKERGVGILFITHDLSLGNYISDKTLILRRGRVVEMGATEKVYGKPAHPYTQMLLTSVPHLTERWDAHAQPPSSDDGGRRRCRSSGSTTTISQPSEERHEQPPAHRPAAADPLVHGRELRRQGAGLRRRGRVGAVRRGDERRLRADRDVSAPASKKCSRPSPQPGSRRWTCGWRT